MQHFGNIEQVAQRASAAVKPPNYESVAGGQIVERPAQRWARSRRAGS